MTSQTATQRRPDRKKCGDTRRQWWDRVICARLGPDAGPLAAWLASVEARSAGGRPSPVDVIAWDALCVVLDRSVVESPIGAAWERHDNDGTPAESHMIRFTYRAIRGELADMGERLTLVLSALRRGHYSPYHFGGARLSAHALLDALEALSDDDLHLLLETFPRIRHRLIELVTVPRVADRAHRVLLRAIPEPAQPRKPSLTRDVIAARMVAQRRRWLDAGLDAYQTLNAAGCPEAEIVSELRDRRCYTGDEIALFRNDAVTLAAVEELVAQELAIESTSVHRMAVRGRQAEKADDRPERVKVDPPLYVMQINDADEAGGDN